MSWRRMPMKFPGTCIVCNEKIQINEVGLWAKGIGIKHEKCAKTNEIQCLVCGGTAGCQHCEFRDICDIDSVSQSCICKRCSNAGDPLAAYQKSAKSKFRLLDLA